MKYLLSHEGGLTASMSSILEHELKRFDIRAEILSVGNDRRSVRIKIPEFLPDFFISIGTSKSFRNLQSAKKLGIRSCFFYQSLLDLKSPSPVELADLIFTDIP